MKKSNLHGYDIPCAHIYTKSRATVQNFIEKNIPKIYEVKPFFHDDRLPKLISGKFDAVKLKNE